MSSALVLMMTAPGLALFYGGLVRRKNVLATLMHSFILLAMISVQWVLWGYSIAFGPDIGGRGGQSGLLGADDRGRRARPVRQNDSASGLYDLSGDVCGHYAGVDHRHRSPSA